MRADKPKICAVTDRPGWSSDIIADALARNLLAFDWTKRTIEGWDWIGELRRGRWDLVLWLSQDLGKLMEAGLDPKRTIALIRGRSLYLNLGTEGVRGALEILIARCCAIGATTERLARVLRSSRDEMNLAGDREFPIFTTSSGVDSRDYYRGADQWHGWRAPMIVGWIGSGSLADDMARGYRIVDEACDDCKDLVKFRPHRVSIDGRIPHRNMRSLYQQFDLFVCLDVFDDCGLTILEAGACGISLISVQGGLAGSVVVPPLEDSKASRRRSGGSRRRSEFESLVHGVNGILLRERSAECLKIALRSTTREKAMGMGDAMRMAITKDWDWEIMARWWRLFIEKGLE